jgi:S-adenosylmethionine-diacylglycerol 3-amino-3-carboxypropyl transferase
MSVQRLQVLEERISYAQVWEDPAVLSAALRIQPDDDVLSVCSAGDNAFALAIDGARSVTCVDISEPQLALAELKLRAAEALPVQSLRSLLGFDAAGRRVWFYHYVRDRLTHRARCFWDDHEALVREGIARAGRFERYLTTFHGRLLPAIHGRATIDRMLALDDPAAQRSLFAREWDTRRWRALFRLFFSEAVMSRRGRSKEQFAFVDGPVSSAFLKRAEHVLCDLPTRTNFFLHWYLTGRFPDLEAAHPYLSTAGHAVLAERAERLRFVATDIETFLRGCEPGAFSAFNYSNIFEYLDRDAHRRILELTVRAARPGARICYWNLLVPRHRPDDLADRIDRDVALGARLLAQDRAFVYGAVQVETVR